MVPKPDVLSTTQQRPPSTQSSTLPPPPPEITAITKGSEEKTTVPQELPLNRSATEVTQKGLLLQSSLNGNVNANIWFTLDVFAETASQ
ncbi:hypothetical protein ANCCEY_01015 [Ancylostoma ceylanicum]|uniref:Uncharacterized protein n=1 Tax=Ancylostoma ceylanicum TaxID=53326 RepID=A0A0D6M727_9BILA|nr:hypothetical protein ANCCEY_01015 [Ancylostoma ceylanicum]